jgi:hypothetical protein
MRVESRIVACLVVSVALVGCGGDGEGADPDASGQPDSGAGGCESAADCPDDQVCEPNTSECAAIPCTEHGDCGTGGYCAEGGDCGHNQTGGPCDEDVNCPHGQTCTGGFCGCQGVLFQAESVPPNVLILLDRSDSMNQPITAGDPTTKWDEALAAVTTLLTDHGDQIRFGLMLYPGAEQVCEDGLNCTVGTVAVDVGDDTAAAIDQFLGDATTCSLMTPTTEALATLPDYDGLEDVERGNYVVLITDGQSNCDADPDDQVALLRGQDPEIRTFVIGFGGAVDPAQLNDMAIEGGTARPTDPLYYVADAPGELGMAFDEIAGTVLSCAYSLEEVPADLDQLYIYFDGEPVSRDETQADGWDYDADANQLTFYGPACDALQRGVSELVIVYGCPVVVD